MIQRFKHGPGVARSTRSFSAWLQIGSRAETPSGSGHEQAAHAVLRTFDVVERVHQSAKHLGRDRVHDLRMVERQDADALFDIKSDAFEFHSDFLLPVWSAACHARN